jgi:hypothetical protein
MAAADYWTCDHCGNAKTFYNSDLVGGDLVSPRDYGAMKVICHKCAKTHDVVIVSRATDLSTRDAARPHE